MSVICATVCNHGMQCVGNCVLGRKGSPVQFYEIEKYISDAYLDRMDCPKPEKKKQKAAVIGAGAAGMTVAIVLARHGYGVTINEEGPVFCSSIFDENGRIIGYGEEREQVYVDTTIIAVSQGQKNKLLLTTEGLEGSEKGLLITDENGMMTRAGVFAAGNVVHGPRTVVHAVEAAKKAAAAMMKYMESKIDF